MARKTDHGVFTPKNPQKYIGPNLHDIRFKSSWECTMLIKLDLHPYVTSWSYESIRIPYRNPLTGRWSMYIPDFFVVYMDRNGKQHIEIIEIKPLKETPGHQMISERTGKPRRLSERDKLVQVINAAKWQAAADFCAKRQIFFRIMTENNLFGR